MINKLLRALARLLGLDTAKATRTPQRYTIREFEDRAAAVTAARRPGVAAVIRSGEQYKWLLFRCPCGCREQIALNLMQSHVPKWKITIRSPDSFWVHPSVNATKCGAHFWLRDGRVTWCE